ncbi:MAG: serine/threonine protein phosphatase PrpC [Planctomycetota bacterium]|jgi:serine/threonine protein phosphatase PrpC
MNDPSTPSIALFGASFIAPGEIHLEAVGPKSACAISVGAQAAIVRKKAEAAPNEDALYLHDDGEIAVQIVADGHYGVEASRALVESLGAIFDEKGTGIEPAQAFGEMAQDWRKRGDLGKSRATVLVAALDRKAGRVQGFSIGDSACFLASASGSIERLDSPSRHYAAPWDLYSLGLPPSSYFEVPVSAGQVLIACTDGVTECHYGHPELSIQMEHIASLVSRAIQEPSVLAEGLGKLALAGVNEHPGGEDNVAITVTIA